MKPFSINSTNHGGTAMNFMVEGTKFVISEGVFKGDILNLVRLYIFVCQKKSENYLKYLV